MLFGVTPKALHLQGFLLLYYKMIKTCLTILYTSIKNTSPFNMRISYSIQSGRTGTIKVLFICSLVTMLSSVCLAQKKYPTLLWKISGNGLKKTSYLYGTMHVSSKAAYHLSDQFYESIKEVEVVGLESDPSKWIEEMDKYNMLDYFNDRNNGLGYTFGNFYADAFKLRVPDNKLYEGMLAFDPEIINSLLFRNSQSKANFEENTYIDLFIYQAGAKWDKKIVSLEDFKTSVIMGKLAAMPDVDEKEKENYDESYNKYGDYKSFESLEDAYRNGDLDAIDSLNKAGYQTENHKKFLIEDRNIIFVHNMDSIMQKQSLFTGVGAAHLPGENGVIELLRKKGYTVEPIKPKTSGKANKIKDKLELTFKPIPAIKQFAEDSSFSFVAPGKLVNIFKDNYISFRIYADMTNSAFYNLIRIKSFGTLQGLDQQKMKSKIDSMLFEYIPGKILSKGELKNNAGYIGFDILNLTRKGDIQRYQIYISDAEVIIFKLGGKTDYVKNKDGKDFFNSITFTPAKNGYQHFSPQTGGFEVNVPANYNYEKSKQSPLKGVTEFVTALDKEKNIFYGITHSMYHDVAYIEEDTFELNQLSRHFMKELKLKDKNEFTLLKGEKYPGITFSGESIKNNQKVFGKILINGTHYYIAYAFGNLQMTYPSDFFNSFKITPFKYIYKIETITDKGMQFSVQDETSALFDNVIDKEVNKQYDQMLKNKKIKDPDYSFDKENLEKYYFSYSSLERVNITYTKFNDYDYEDKNEFWKNIKKNVLGGATQKISRVKQKKENGIETLEFLLTDTASVRGILYKGILKQGVYRELMVPMDTTLGTQGWVSDFMNTFKPTDSIIGKDIFENKFKACLKDLTSADSATRSRASISLSNFHFENVYENDFIAFLSDPQFIGITEADKAQLFVSVADMNSNKVIEPYKKMYKQYQDSSYLQLCLIKGLGYMKTNASYAAITELLAVEPPLIGDENTVQEVFDVFYDSLELCKQFYPKLFSLTRFQEYKKPIFNLLSSLVTKKIISSAEYVNTKQDILTEANYELKRYNAASQDDNKKNNNYNEYDDYIQDALNDVQGGKKATTPTINTQADIFNFVVLLAPLYKTDEPVKFFFNKLYKIKDEDLMLSVYTELLKYGNNVNDTIWKHYASRNESRIDLYKKLKEIKQTAYFPKEFADQQLFCEAYIQNRLKNKYSYSQDKKDKEKTEKITFFKTIDAQNKREKGKIYIFKREDTRNKEERWACVFVEDSKELNTDINTVDISLVLSKSKTNEEYITELIEDFYIKYRRRGWNSYDNY